MWLQVMLLGLLLGGLVAPGGLGAQPAGPRSGPLLPVVRRLHPIQSFRELVDWFERHGQRRRALEIVSFGLAHHPGDHGLLTRAARLNLHFGDPAAARIFASRALAVRPEDSEMRAFLKRLDAPAPSAGATSPATAPAEATPVTTAAATPAAEPLGLPEKLRLLSLMRAVSSAITAYDQHHRKKPLEKLDLEALRGGGFLPAGFAPPGLSELEYAEGVLSHPVAGSLTDLAAAVGGYRKALAEVEEWLAKDLPHEALRDLKGVVAAHGRTPEVRALENRIWRRIAPERAAREAADFPDETPGLAVQKGLDLWQSGQREAAQATFARVPERWPDSAHARVARHLGNLASRGFDLSFLYSFYEQRARSLAASAATTSTTATAPSSAPPDN